MKLICKSILIAAALLASVSICQAGPGKTWPLDGYTNAIKSKEEAQKLPAKANVALACKDCKTVVASCCVDDKPKSFLSWFKADETHGCSGCGGKITFVGQQKSPTIAHSHECSKCGKDSAYTCADHASNVK